MTAAFNEGEGVGMSGDRRGGWNQRVPEGVARCTCAARRLLWAQLRPEMSQGCCTRSCCEARVSAVMCTREEVLDLRARAYRERWACPRCGELVANHLRNFECLDRSVKAVRAKKQARYHPTGRTP